MKRSFSLLFLLLFVTNVSLLQAEVINLVENFPNNQGDNNFYAYAFNIANNNYRLLQDNGEYVFQDPTGILGTPIVKKELALDILYLHPECWYPGGYQPEDAVLGWRVPHNGYAEINGMFSLGNSRGNVIVYVKRNGELLWEKELSQIDRANFNISQMYLRKNDYIYFGSNAKGDFSFDWTNLVGDINFTETDESPNLSPVINLLLGD